MCTIRQLNKNCFFALLNNSLSKEQLMNYDGRAARGSGSSSADFCSHTGCLEVLVSLWQCSS